MAFFSLLPADLQIDVFHTWLDDEIDLDFLRRVSALDVACCSRAHRPTFLFLARSLKLKPSTHDGNVNVKIDSNCVWWLADRGIAIKSLHCTDSSRSMPNHGIKLLSVTELHMGSPLALQLAGRALELCPGISSIEDKASSCAGTGTIWSTLTEVSFAKLTELVTIGHAMNDAVLVRALERNGSQLVHLEMLTVRLTDKLLKPLVQTCTNLRMLAVAELDLSASSMYDELFQGCRLLTGLRLGEHCGHDLLALMRAAGRDGRKMKAFECFRCPASSWSPAAHGSVWEQFADILLAHPSLQSLRLATIGYDADSQSLRIASAGMVNANGHMLAAALGHIHRIMGVCKSITALDFSSFSNCDTAKCMTEFARLLIGKHCLKELVLKICVPTSFQFFEQFPHLLRLELRGEIGGEVFEMLAKHCKHLQHFILHAWTESITVTDAGMELLFASCPHLQEVKLACSTLLTYSTLQSILTNKLGLRKLSYLHAGFGQAAIDKFCQLAQQQQLLPVTLFECLE